MKYKVQIIETYKEIIEVEADDEDKALSDVWQRYQDEDSLGGEVTLEEVKIELC